MKPIDFAALPTPCYAVDEVLLQRNLEILAGVQARTGCSILLALKGFSMYETFPLVGQYLKGITASSLHEARLGREHMGKEVHVYAPAFRDDEIDELAALCDHIVFNSFAQWQRFRDRVRRADHPISCGIRVNPGYAEVEHEIYNPCASGSRLGVPAEHFQPDGLEGLDGLHFHALCEQGSDTLQRVAEAFEQRFGSYLHGMRWLNMGGGHHITREGYDVALLERIVGHFQDKYRVHVYLEPGEAIALNTGFLVTQVLDVVRNGMDIAILDTSAACHMPDVLEMPYRPQIIGAALPGELPHTYRLGGPTCLAGDVIGDYSFAQPLQPGDRLVFTDMAHYTMVKNNTFNGIGLPAIAVRRLDGELKVLKRFGYEDYKSRL